MARRSKFRDSARGEDCQVRLPGICNHNPETVVLAHLPDGTGGKMGGKSYDLCSVYACSSCHDTIDRRAHTEKHRDWVMLAAYDGHMRTLNKFVEKGLISA